MLVGSKKELSSGRELGAGDRPQQQVTGKPATPPTRPPIQSTKKQLEALDPQEKEQFIKYQQQQLAMKKIAEDWKVMRAGTNSCTLGVV